MKKLSLILFFSVLAIVACKKDLNDQTGNSATLQRGITYPDSIYYGKNILSYPDSTVLQEAIDYEIGAILENDASLSLVITNYPEIDTATGRYSVWFHSSESGWIVGDYNDTSNTQSYTATQTGKVGGKILFLAYGQTGSCKIDFYENGSIISRTKYFIWQ